MSISFKKGAAEAVVLETQPGSVKYGDGNKINGGGLVPPAVVGYARNGSCQVLIDDTDFTVEDALALVSPKGAGDYVITGSDLSEGQYSYDALVDVVVEGDSVMIANISWKGTTIEEV